MWTHPFIRRCICSVVFVRFVVLMTMNECHFVVMEATLQFKWVFALFFRWQFSFFFLFGLYCTLFCRVPDSSFKFTIFFSLLYRRFIVPKNAKIFFSYFSISACEHDDTDAEWRKIETIVSINWNGCYRTFSCFLIVVSRVWWTDHIDFASFLLLTLLFRQFFFYSKWIPNFFQYNPDAKMWRYADESIFCFNCNLKHWFFLLWVRRLLSMKISNKGLPWQMKFSRINSKQLPLDGDNVVDDVDDDDRWHWWRQRCQTAQCHRYSACTLHSIQWTLFTGWNMSRCQHVRRTALHIPYLYDRIKYSHFAFIHLYWNIFFMNLISIKCMTLIKWQSKWQRWKSWTP